MTINRTTEKEGRRHNSTFAIGGVTCFYDTFVVTESSVLRMNICGKNPAHRKSAKRYLQAWKTDNMDIN